MRAKRFLSILFSLGKIILVAALYMATARLGFLMALPPGNVTALWPPSGLALAAIFIWGNWMGLGIFAGSLLVNWGSLSGPAALAVAAAIAFGSTLQAWAVAWLIRRFIRVLPPQTIPQTILVIAISALGTLLAPSVGVTSLCIAGYASWSNYLTLYWAWWLGDLIGVLVFAPVPITLSLRWRKQPAREAHLWALTSFIIGLALFVFFVAQNYTSASEGWVAWASLLVGLLLAGAFLAYVDIRQKAEAALRQKEAEYRLIAENTGDVIWILDIESQRFTYMSPAVEKLRGGTVQEALGSSMSEALTPESFEKIMAVFPQRLADFQQDPHKNNYRDELDQVRKDGSVVTTEVTTTFATNDAGLLQVVGISRDINERKQAEDLLREQSRQLRILFDASQRLSRSLDLQEIYQAICDFMSGIAPNDGLVISSYDPQTRLITCRAYWMETGWMDVSDFPPIPLEEEGKGVQSMVIRSGQSMLINDYQAQLKSAQSNYYVDDKTSEIFEEVPEDEEIIRSGLVVPLKTGDMVSGVIQVTSCRLNAYNETQLKLLEALALHIVSAEKNALLYAQVQAELNERKQTEVRLHNLSRTHAVLSDVNKTIVRVHEPQKLFEATCKIAVEQGGFQMVWIGQLDQEKRQVIPVAWAGETGDYLEHLHIILDDTPVGHGPTANAFRYGQPVVINDIATDPSMAPSRQRALNLGYRALVAFPLVTMGEVNGTISLYANEPGFFDENEIKLLSEVAEDIAFALEFIRQEQDRKQADEALKKSQASLETAQSIARLGSWELDLQTGYGNWSKEMFQLMQSNPADGTPSFDAFVEKIHPQDRETLLDAHKRAIQSGKLVMVEYRVTPSPQELRYIKTNIQPTLDENSQITRLSGTVLDITELKLVQQELLELNRDLEQRVEERTAQVRQSESTYRALFENSNDGIFLLSPQGVELQANRRAMDMLGYGMDEWGTVGNEQVIAPEQQQEANRLFQAVLNGEQVPLYERTFIAKGGRRIEVEVNLSAIRDMNGKVVMVQSVVRDITERKKAEDTLRENEERYRRAISAADAVPYSLDYASSAYTFMGEGIERITGYARDEMTPTLFDSFIQETRMRGDLANLSTHESTQLVRAGRVPGNAIWRSDFRIQNKAGENRWLSDSSVQVVDKNGQITGSIGILQDITERKEAEEALRDSRDKLSAANAALEKASRLKDEFLASMSHELRTPLTGILGLSEALQLMTYGEMNEKQLKSIKNIETSGRHLLDLINDILDLSKIEAGKLDLQFETAALREICQASLQLVKGMAHQKQQIISFEMQPGAINLRTDGRRLKQMLVNLLSNAVKFTPSGGKLGLDVRANPEQKVVTLSVWDKGIGIHPEEMGKLFKPFVQLDSSLARQYSGTGLGLSLVQRMAELHGGSISVESTPGEGSRFSIQLPWYTGLTQPLPELLGGTEPLKNTLVIEDNVLDAEHISRYLMELGIKNVVQPVLRGALEKVAQLRPSVVLLDLHLPDGSGMELLGRLKADSRTRDTPVVIVSVEERRSEAIRLGASGYLVKPVSREDLHNQLVKVAAFVHPSNPVMVIATAHIAPLVMIADDNELILETLSDFLENRNFRVVATRSGFELLERAAELHPDIILMDIQMPGLDGLETTIRLRAHSDKSLAATPVIAITALAMTGDREKCLQAGANEYMSKPIGMLQLLKSIHQLLDGSI